MVTLGGATIIVTASDQATAPATVTEAAQVSKGPNTAGIVAGVVVGVIVIAAIIGGAWLYLRTRRRRAVEEEYRRNAAINNFVGGSKPGSTPSLSDSRLEPSVMMQRRLSDGSIADNQDYSRRILKVNDYLKFNPYYINAHTVAGDKPRWYIVEIPPVTTTTLITSISIFNVI